MPLQGEYAPSTEDWAREQAERYEATDGAEANVLAGTEWPIIVLTNVGAKSGRLHKTPLMRVEHDGRYAVVASKGGAPRPPAWYANVKAHPHVELQDGAAKRDYLARELDVDSDEYAEWWERAVAAYPPYAEYQERTSRRIAVFILEPMAA
ncbi:nitroreductase family deazaflavin-dependent oxidoreductase [Microbacterium oryzae]|uniref:nitroreductase family deazaflavin-dependent oxidoreductase n=1 Tax=Microbacterium oryzae TaxID=743009 RepID=UPI0025B024D7|nr:nitroreductase family deazaflavin-dependent oxidoreductase [Microbacterium oryzae]MDN3310052.1 nitroreductase family deazaflavin-dependent oxidoreductase [Microbacterium oryzae]